ncbi:MAG: exo-alpha-sialidase [Balneolaceae bacterium]|nr:exo-alpha-sialidase [Balneolaceae bacterium]
MNRSQTLLYTLLISFFLLNCTESVTITEIENPANEQGKYPRLYTDNTGAVFMSWMVTTNDTTTLYYSKYENEQWSRPSLISASDAWFVNWADFPSIIASNGEPLASHWLQKKPGGTYSYDVTISQFRNNEFADPVIPHSDNTPTEHGFVSMLPMSDEAFYAIWLDGRNMTGGHGSESGDHGSTLDQAMTLRGAKIGSDQPIEEMVIDNSVCECCGTTLAQSGNNLIAAYRNRTADEIRDIYIAKMDIETGEWSEPQNISNDNWQINACPVNGPQLASNDDLVALAWFTGADDIAKVKLRTSTDGGNNWLETKVLESEKPLGRVDVTITPDNNIWVSWMSRVEDTAVLKLASFDEAGNQLSMHVVNEVSPSRSGGFPQLTLIGDTKIVAWTDVSEDQPRIRTKLIR